MCAQINVIHAVNYVLTIMPLALTYNYLMSFHVCEGEQDTFLLTLR